MMKQENSNLLKYEIILYIHIILQGFVLIKARGSSLNCTFEIDFCGWNQEESDRFDWRRRKGRTKTGGTGPEADHTTGSGYYIYIEANGRNKHDTARITSPMQEPGPHCFSVWYSMFGSHIGALTLYKKIYGGTSVIFAQDKDLEIPDWQKAVISLNTSAEFQIVIEGISGKNVKGDIAIDDISMTDGLCSVDCNFETGLCQWIQDYNDDFDWTWQKGDFKTDNMGPPEDHASGEGYYIYIDTSEAENGKNARIISPWQYPGVYCFVFWYYMYGMHVELKILKQDEQTTTELITIARGQGQKWMQDNAFINSTIRFRIIIKGSVRSHDEHDGGIALDDLLMRSCQDCDDPTPRNGNSNSTDFQYNSEIQITCNSGYYIKGNASIVCQVGGTWSGNPTCELSESQNSAVIAVYVLVPVAAVAVVIVLLFVICRQKAMGCFSALCAARKHDTREQPHSASPISNVTYSDHYNEIEPNTGDVLSEDTEYAIIIDNDNGEDDKHVYYNTIDAMITEQDKAKHNYDHANLSATPVLGTSNNYSHLSEENDTTSVPCPGKVTFQTDTKSKKNSYRALYTKTSKQSTGTNMQSSMTRDQDPEYNYTEEGVIAQVDLDGYSHLNDKTVYQKPNECSETESNMLDMNLFSSILKSTEINDKTNETVEATYEQAVGETPVYLILDAENGDTVNNKTNEMA